MKFLTKKTKFGTTMHFPEGWEDSPFWLIWNSNNLDQFGQVQSNLGRFRSIWTSKRILSSHLINSFALMSLINQWLGLVNGRLLSLRYKTLSKECKEINNGDVVSSIKLLQMALNRNWLITVESVTKFPRAKGLCFSYISISSRIVKVCDIQSLNNIIVWNSGHVTFGQKIMNNRTV